MKLIILLFLITATLPLFAQEVQIDSIKIKKIAVTDADNKFKISKSVRQAYRQKQLSSTSDYFKPTFYTTSNPKLLNDSNYVKKFRYTAFESTVDQIKLNRTKLIVVGAVVVGVVATVVIIVKIVEKIGDAFADSLTRVLI